MNYTEKTKLIQTRAAALLEAGEVSYVLGWGATRFADKTRARFARSPEEAATLVYNEHCTQSLAKYLVDDRWPETRIAILARGCESRAINRMIRDNQIRRENLLILGLPCEGTDAERCRSCRAHDPVVYDELLWEPNSTGAAAAAELSRYYRADAVDALSAAEKKAYWDDVYARCIRCYACRNACPVCSCRECFVDMHRTGFQGKRHSATDNQTFGVTRAFHVGDRCIECGECERACPMGLPILAQTQKILKEIEALAGDYEQGLDAAQDNYLGAFDLDDKDDFM
ncbi:MAG: 4Fe-4S dicluster domain-containing protein [Clostridiales Family XIII bacterium]|jgi:ferredoxin|nr:4Fe-4S dicluster domain-containing protein [Clostridiales Family XIII bacterium]